MKNRRFVLIGGGELGRPGYPYETLEIDKEVVSLASKQTVLFVGLAQVTSGESHITKYYNCIKNNYQNLGCDVINFDCYNFDKDIQNTKKQILDAGIIYFGGGDTKYLVDTLKKYKLDKTILKACDNGTVLAGLSAGANLMGKIGLSLVNYKKYQAREPVGIDGFDMLPFVIVPHFASDEIRQEQLQVYLKQNSNFVGLGIDNGCAFVCNGNKCKTVHSLLNSKIHICKCINNNYIQKDLSIKQYVNIEDIF